MEIRNCIFFMNISVQRGQNENFDKNKIATQHLETRNYWLRALSDVKKIIRNQCDLNFYECFASHRRIYVALNEHVRDTFVILTEVSHLSQPFDDWTWPSNPTHHIRVLWGSWLGIKQAKARRWRHFEHGIMWLFAHYVRFYIVMLENARARNYNASLKLSKT